MKIYEKIEKDHRPQLEEQVTVATAASCGGGDGREMEREIDPVEIFYFFSRL